MSDTTQAVDADLANLRLALRDRLGVDADAEVDDAGLMDLLDEALTKPDAEGEPAPVKLEERTILHSLFSYDLPGGGAAVALRGDTVSLLPHDIERGERFEAFTARVGDEPTPPKASRLAPLGDEPSIEDADAWVVSGTVSDILAAVNVNPHSAQAVLEAEQRRGSSARKSLIQALALVLGSEAAGGVDAKFTKGRRTN